MDDILEATAIPVELARKTIAKLPYASQLRVGLKLLFYTGSRITELDRMSMGQIKDKNLWWKIGKNQKGWRYEPLPDDFIIELVQYRRRHRVPGDRILACNANTFSRQFRFARQDGSLPPEWILKRPNGMKEDKWTGAKEFTYQYTNQLKGFRKTFATLYFAKMYLQHDDAYIALECTFRRMKHSSKHITAYHYLREFEKVFNTIKPKDVKSIIVVKALENVSQPPLTAWL